MPLCPEIENFSLNISPEESVASYFERSEVGPLFSETLIRYGGNKAEEAFAAIAAAIGTCHEWQENDPDIEAVVVYRLSLLPFVEYGDETFAFKIVFSALPVYGEAHLDFALVRYDDVLLLLFYMPSESIGEPDMFPALAEMADSKLKAALEP